MFTKRFWLYPIPMFLLSVSCLAPLSPSESTQINDNYQGKWLHDGLLGPVKSITTRVAFVNSNYDTTAALWVPESHSDYNIEGLLTRTVEFDTIGDTIQIQDWTYFANGRISRYSDKYHRNDYFSEFIQTFDLHGNMLEGVTRGADGSILSITTNSYDDKGNLLRAQTVDSAGNIVPQDTTNKTVKTYDSIFKLTYYHQYSQGKLTSVTVIDDDLSDLRTSQTTVNPDGIIQYKRVMVWNRDTTQSEVFVYSTYDILSSYEKYTYSNGSTSIETYSYSGNGAVQDHYLQEIDTATGSNVMKRYDSSGTLMMSNSQINLNRFQPLSVTAYGLFNNLDLQMSYDYRNYDRFNNWTIVNISEKRLDPPAPIYSIKKRDFEYY